jgi:hypothetical protein
MPKPRVIPKAAMKPRISAALTLAALAGCSTVVGDGGPAEVELANIRPSNIIPKTKPSQLISTFERVCMAKTIEAARAELRDLDYVKARPSRGNAAVESYYSDNRRPAVGMQPAAGGFDCVMTVEARTGQTNAVDDYVAGTFPVRQAQSRDGFERFWLAPGANGGILFTQRKGRPLRPERFTFGVMRPVAPPQATANREGA